MKNDPIKDDYRIAMDFTSKHHLLTKKLNCVGFILQRCSYFCTVFHIEANIHDNFKHT